jgi:acyl-CoA dehydrogenase
VPFQGFDLPEDLQLLSDTVAEFVRDEIRPAEARVPGDARDLPEHELTVLQQKARAAGFWCLEAPQEFGGGGLSVFEGIVLTEQMAKHRYSFPHPGAGVFGIDPPVVLYKGTEQQIEKYVRPTIEHAWSAFTAISEPTGGSDPARAIRTTATKDGDTYRINGHKMWTTGADSSRYGIVYARTDPTAGRGGISAIIVDADTPGMNVTSVPVLRDHWTTEVTFDNCVVPAENLVGEEGQGFALAQQWLVRGRLRYAAQAIGVAEEAVRMATEWASSRETFGALLATRQAVQFALADAKVKLAAARHLTWEAAWDADQGRDARTKASMAKLYGTEAGFEVVDAMMQILGGMGMTKDLPLERWYREMRIRRVGEGPSEVQRMVIAREILGSNLR